MIFATQVVVASLFSIGSVLAVIVLNLCAFFSPIAAVAGLGMLGASFFLPDPSLWVMAGIASFIGSVLLSIIRGALERD